MNKVQTLSHMFRLLAEHVEPQLSHHHRPCWFLREVEDTITSAINHKIDCAATEQRLDEIMRRVTPQRTINIPDTSPLKAVLAPKGEVFYYDEYLVIPDELLQAFLNLLAEQAPGQVFRDE